MAKNEDEKYAYLDRLSTKQLDALLRADIESTESSNQEVIFHILEVIVKREEEHPAGRLSDVDKAWEEFQTYYNIPEGDGLSLYPSEEEEDEDDARPVTAAPGRFRMRRVLIAAVVAACLVVFAMPPALGYQNFFQMIGQWTESVYRFRPEGAVPPQNSAPADDVPHAGEYESLQAALDDYGITEMVAPTEITAGYLPVSITATKSPEFGTVDIRAFYENNAGKTISISITKRASSGSHNYEKGDASVTPYVVDDITHYVFENHDRIAVTWYVETLECSIKTDLSLVETKKLIDSIYGR